MALKFEQDSREKIKYTLDWTEWLDDTTISSATVTFDGEDLIVSDAANTTTSVTFWAEAGINGATYNIVVKVTASDGQVGVRTVELKIDPK